MLLGPHGLLFIGGLSIASTGCDHASSKIILHISMNGFYKLFLVVDLLLQASKIARLVFFPNFSPVVEWGGGEGGGQTRPPCELQMTSAAWWFRGGHFPPPADEEDRGHTDSWVGNGVERLHLM